MVPFDDKEWRERIEAVKDSMAIYLKAEFDFEVDNTEVYVEHGGRGDTISVDIDIVGSFTNLIHDGSIIAAILKDYPYKDVVTFMNNIYEIKADEIREILAKYTPIVKDKLTNWLNNIKQEYIVKLSQEYWDLREECFVKMCEKGDIFN